MNAILGALGAAILALGTAATALLTGPNVDSFADITQIQWAILGIGGVLVFIKDWQAISARRLINKVTGTGDGGGSI